MDSLQLNMAVVRVKWPDALVNQWATNRYAVFDCDGFYECLSNTECSTEPEAWAAASAKVIELGGYEFVLIAEGAWEVRNISAWRYGLPMRAATRELALESAKLDYIQKHAAQPVDAGEQFKAALDRVDQAVALFQEAPDAYHPTSQPSAAEPKAEAMDEQDEFANWPPCIHCTHTCTEHDEEFGICSALPGVYHPNNYDGCQCPGYAQSTENCCVDEGGPCAKCLSSTAPMRPESGTIELPTNGRITVNGEEVRHLLDSGRTFVVDSGSGPFAMPESGADAKEATGANSFTPSTFGVPTAMRDKQGWVPPPNWKPNPPLPSAPLMRPAAHEEGVDAGANFLQVVEGSQRTFCRCTCHGKPGGIACSECVDQNCELRDGRWSYPSHLGVTYDFFAADAGAPKDAKVKALYPYDFSNDQVLAEVQDTNYAKGHIEHHLQHMTSNERMSLYRAIAHLGNPSLKAELAALRKELDECCESCANSDQKVALAENELAALKLTADKMAEALGNAQWLSKRYSSLALEALAAYRQEAR